MAKSILVALCAIVLFATVQATQYEGYKVFHITFDTDLQFDMLYQLEQRTNTEKDFMFWQLSHAEMFADVMVAPHRIADFTAFLKITGYSFKIIVDDVQKEIDNTK